MNKARIEQLDIAFTVLREWIDYCRECKKHGDISVPYSVWLHDQYKKARVGK